MFYSFHFFTGLRNIISALAESFRRKGVFFTAAGSPSGGRTLALAKKNTPYHPKIYPQSLLSLTMTARSLFIKCLTLKIRTSIYREHKQHLRRDFARIRPKDTASAGKACAREASVSGAQYKKWKQTRIHFGFVTFFWSASGERAVSERDGRGGKQCRAFMRTLLPAFIRRAS